MLELDVYYDKTWKTWVLIVLDENGNQMFDAEYFSNKTSLAFAIENF